MNADCPRCGSKAFVEVGIPREKVCAKCGLLPSRDAEAQRIRIEGITGAFLGVVEVELRQKVQQAIGSIPRLARLGGIRENALIDLLCEVDTLLLVAESPGGEEADLALGKLRQAWVRAGGELSGGNDA